MSQTLSYCQVSLAPLRSEAKDSSEMVSQMVFGETFEIREELRQWRKVRSLEDGYEGWTDEKLLFSISEEQLKQWTQERKPLFNELLTIGSINGNIRLTRGAYITSAAAKDFQIGGNEYSLSSELVSTPKSVTEIALSYKNAPYLWGGKSLFGIDCSGFTQSVFRFLNIALPRDADQQVLTGKEIKLEEIKEGDVAFFENASGKTHHVGILLAKNKIIHAHGQIRIDKFDAKGIFNAEKESYSHRLSCIKRYF